MRKMNKLKKLLRVTGTLLVAGAVLTACGKNDESADGSDANGEITLRMSWWGNDDRHKATLDAIEKFEAANPGIKVKAEYSGWEGIVEKMATQIAGGTEADVMQINYDWYNTYSKDGTGFADLNEYKDIIDLSGYSEDSLSAANINGKLNGIPFGVNNSVLAINKTKFEEFGINIDDLKTWDDYKEAAKKFPEGHYPLLFNSFNEVMTSLTQKYGKAFLSDDGEVQYTVEQVAEGLDWYKDLVDSGTIPSAATVIETTGTSHVSTVKEYIEGQYDGIFDWTGGLASYAAALEENGMELVIPTYPTVEEGQSAGVIKKPSMLFSISKNSKHPKEAAKLLNFLLNDPEGVKAMGTVRGLPAANENAMKILEEAGQVDEISKAANDFVQETEGVMESPYYEMSQVVEAYKSAFNKFTMGQTKDSKVAAKEIIDNTKAVIEEIKAQ
jgi:oligogalacturonide transport system substrate-binding protein